MKRRIYVLKVRNILQITLTVASTVMGLLETLGACVVDEWPSMRSYKPAIVFTLLSAIFMTNLVMATKGMWLTFKAAGSF